MEIKKVDFEKYKPAQTDVSFEDLDINGDDVINKEDKNLAKNPEIFNMISHLLNSTDEEDELQLVDDFDFLEKSGSAKTSNLSSKATTTQTSDCPDGNCGETLSTNDCPGGNCSISGSSASNDCPDGNCSVELPSETTPARVQNSDGTYTETKTNANGATVAITYDANNKKVSSKTTNKDGSVVTSTYKYNSDGSYSVTTKYADKTRVTKYNSAGKKISYTDKFNNGTTKTATFKYNSNGSYSVIIKNKKKGTATTVKYNASGKKTSSVTKNKKGKTTNKKTYKYNTDGSYTETVQKYSTGWGKGSVKINTYNANGKKVKAGASTASIANATASNYKSKLNPNGVTFVIFTGPNCGHCDQFHDTFKSVLPATSSLANFVEINSKADGDSLLNSLMNKLNNKLSQYPIIIKYVNGKPTEAFHPEENNAAKLLDEIRKKAKS